MGYFDFLIEKGLEPDSDKEYMYLFHMAWKEGSLESLKMEYGTIVYVASRKDDVGHSKGYYFVVKETGEVFQCNYSWAFAENTTENVEAVKNYRECAARVKQLEKQRDELWGKVVTLKIKKEIQ